MVNLKHLEFFKNRLNSFTPAQKRILYNLYTKIKVCESTTMPKKYWCDECKVIWIRINELFKRFDLMNNAHECEYITDTTEYFGFSKPDST